MAKAKEVGKVSLDNGTAPFASGLTEAAVANMEAFLDYLWMLLPALRVDMFLQHSKPKGAVLAHQAATDEPKFELVSNKKGIHATATLIDGEFVVLEGSSTTATWVSAAKTNHSYSDLNWLS